MKNPITGASIILLLIHIAFVCHGVIPRPQGIVGNLGDKLFMACTRLFFVADETKSKLCMLLLMIPELLVVRPAERRINVITPLAWLLSGLIPFFIAGCLLPVGSDQQFAIAYTVMTVFGYFAAEASVSKLARATRYVFDQRHFRSEGSGFKQAERLIVTNCSLNFETRYLYKGKKRKGYVNIVNPRRGVLVLGTPGSGKTRFIIEPAIGQLTEQGRALLVYDHKFPDQTNLTYAAFQQNSHMYPASTRFYCINFTDLSRSHRCNLLDLVALNYNSDAVGISQTILFAMNKSWIRKQGEFFQESSISFLAALIWFLRGYKGGIYCTLPHVIELSKTSYEKLFTLLYAEASTRGMVIPFVEAYLNNTMEMVDGQIASVRMPLTKLDSLDIFYVLSGQFSFLDINDPVAPCIVCVGGNPARQEALAPVLSLCIDQVNKRINQPGKYPSALVLDEFATVRATSVLATIATGRSNDIIPILCVQDLSQLKLQYSPDEAQQIMSTTGNLICGQVTGDTARQACERFHQGTHLKTTISVNSSDVSTSKTEQPTDEITPADLAQLSSGEFAGIAADDPDRVLEIKAFRARFLRKGGDLPPVQLPIVANVTKELLAENYARIGKEVADLVELEMKRIATDPALKQFIVKR